jgi:DNA polymerase-3 subunit delta
MASLDVPGLKRRIGRRDLAPIHLFLGEDVRLVERMVADVEATVDPADQPFAVERIYAGEAGGSPLDIAAAARVFPMLGDRRIVIVLRAERLLKPRRAGRADEPDTTEGEPDAEAPADMQPLEDYVAAPVPSTSLVFVAADVDRTRRFTKTLLQAAEVTEFSGLDAGGPGGRGNVRAAALDFVREEFQRIGRAIEPAAVQLLVDRAGGDITKLRGDVERLLLYTEGQATIARDDVDEVASIASDVDDWAVVNAIADGDAPRALREVAARFDRGDSPHAMVGQLRWWVTQRLAEGAPDRVPPALEALLRTDLALKSSAGEDRVLVERLVIDLVGRPVSRQGWGGARRG